MTGRYIVMGVSGCGKSHIGQALAHAAGLRFRDGDDLHPAANIDKMRRGAPLTDADRAPWLDLIAAELAGSRAEVIACSALKRAYRERIAAGAGGDLTFIFLRGQRETLLDRMSSRPGHFMPTALLDSQLATLEEPGADEPVVIADIENTPEQIVTSVLEQIARRSP